MEIFLLHQNDSIKDIPKKVLASIYGNKNLAEIYIRAHSDNNYRGDFNLLQRHSWIHHHGMGRFNDRRTYLQIFKQMDERWLIGRTDLIRAKFILVITA